MVHALEEIHRLLRPDGSLIDIHPSPEAPLVEIHQDGKAVFAEPVPEHACQDKQQAEKALAEVVRRRLFTVQRADVFDFRVYAATLVELRSFLEEASAFEDSPPDEEAAAWQAELAAQVAEAMQAAGEGAEVAFHEQVRITWLTPSPACLASRMAWARSTTWSLLKMLETRLRTVFRLTPQPLG